MRIIVALAVTFIIAAACSQPEQPIPTKPPETLGTKTTTDTTPAPDLAAPTIVPTTPVITPTEFPALAASPTPPPPVSKPTITSTTVPAATPPLNEADPFVETLSIEELDCFPTTVEADQQLISLIQAASSPFNNDYVNCLTDDHQFDLYLRTVRSTETEFDQLPLETHHCIWNGLQPIFKYDFDQVDKYDEDGMSTLMAATFIAPIAVMAYCVSEENLQRLSYAEPNIETSYMRCVVEHQGGARAFVQTIIDNPNTFEAAMAASELFCDESINGSSTAGSQAPTNLPTTTP